MALQLGHFADWTAGRKREPEKRQQLATQQSLPPAKLIINNHCNLMQLSAINRAPPKGAPLSPSLSLSFSPLFSLLLETGPEVAVALEAGGSRKGAERMICQKEGQRLSVACRNR